MNRLPGTGWTPHPVWKRTGQRRARTGMPDPSQRPNPRNPRPVQIPRNGKNLHRTAWARASHSVPLPADLPSGDDDDVVARQLREAALKEQDPVLREKLWDEYRAYKKQQASVNTPPSGAEY